MNCNTTHYRANSSSVPGDPTSEIETAEAVAARIRRALPHISADRIIVAPDCGLKYLPRDAAFGKMKAMVEGARLMRSEAGGAK